MERQGVDRLGLKDSTYVIYMSDNGAGGGGGGGRRVLNGGKGDVYEGGIRVPFIVRGPGVKANAWCHTRVVGYDLYPTFCEWAGIPRSKWPKGLEGGSIAGPLSNAGQGKVQRSREELVFHFPHYQGDTPHSAILLGDLKLLHFYEDDRDVLFDLSNDLSESHDLAAAKPAETRMLRERLQKYLSDVDAQFPTPNPQFDPSRPPPAARKKGGGKRGGVRKETP